MSFKCDSSFNETPVKSEDKDEEAPLTRCKSKYAIPILYEQEKQPQKRRTIECHICGQQVGDQAAFEKHYDQLHHGLSLEDGSVFRAMPKKKKSLICHVCNEPQEDQGAFFRHYDALHSNLRLEDGSFFRAMAAAKLPTQKSGEVIHKTKWRCRHCKKFASWYEDETKQHYQKCKNSDNAGK